jgi:hypothetical protein
VDITATVEELRKQGIPKGDLTTFAGFCGKELGFDALGDSASRPCAKDARRTAFPKVGFAACDPKKCSRVHVHDATGPQGERAPYGDKLTPDLIIAMGKAMPTTLSRAVAAGGFEP